MTSVWEQRGRGHEYQFLFARHRTAFVWRVFYPSFLFDITLSIGVVLGEIVWVCKVETITIGPTEVQGAICAISFMGFI